MSTKTLTPTTDEMLAARISTRRASLAKQRAERKDPDDLILSPHERLTYIAETARIDAKIAAIHTASAALAELGSVDALTRWQTFLPPARDTISNELLALPRRIRDRATLDLQDGLHFCLKLIDHGFGAATLGIVTLEPTRLGQLMQAAGFDAGAGLRGPNGWGGSLPEVAQRIEELTKRRAAAQAALDDALMDDDECVKRDAESAVLREAYNQMHIKGSPDGLGYVVVDEDGAPRDLATLSAIERKAFERMDALERQYRQDVRDRQAGR